MSQYIIYGSGKWGRYAFLTLHEEKSILFFVDRDRRKWGSSLFGRWICDPEVLGDYPEATVCIAVENSEGIEDYLRTLGVSRVERFILRPEDDKVPCIVYGSGRNAEEFCREYGKRFLLSFFVDDLPERFGHRLLGKTVYPPGWMEDFPGMTVVDAMEREERPRRILDAGARDYMRYRPGEGLTPMLLREERREPVILVDVTIRRKGMGKEGVARVADNVLDALERQGGRVLPVRNMNGTLVTDGGTFGRGEGPERIVEFLRGDVLYLLDPTWNDSEDFRGYIREARERGAKTYGIVHDFLPDSLPDCFTESISAPFFLWYDMVLSEADAILCDSKCTAKRAEPYFRKRGLCREGKSPLEVYPVRLGTGFRKEAEAGEVRPELKEFLEEGPVFLMVGTLEPRKGHQTVLEAFRLLWEREPGWKLLFLGHDGWLNGALKEAMTPYQGNKLLWLRDAADAELQWAYGHAEALIAASLDEGFGLPLVEAAVYGCPILCSDIEVFHEVAGEGVFYFPPGDPKGLAKAVLVWKDMEQKPDSTGMEVLSWEDVAGRLLDVFRGKATPDQWIL